MRPPAVTGLQAPVSPGPSLLYQGLKGTLSGTDLTHLQNASAQWRIGRLWPILNQSFWIKILSEIHFSVALRTLWANAICVTIHEKKIWWHIDLLSCWLNFSPHFCLCNHFIMCCLQQKLSQPYHSSIFVSFFSFRFSFLH